MSGEALPYLFYLSCACFVPVPVSLLAFYTCRSPRYGRALAPGTAGRLQITTFCLFSAAILQDWYGNLQERSLVPGDNAGRIPCILSAPVSATSPPGRPYRVCDGLEVRRVTCSRAGSGLPEVSLPSCGRKRHEVPVVLINATAVLNPSDGAICTARRVSYTTVVFSLHIQEAPVGNDEDRRPPRSRLYFLPCPLDAQSPGSPADRSERRVGGGWPGNSRGLRSG